MKLINNFSYLKENSIFDDEEMCSSEECIENIDIPEEDEQDDKISSIKYCFQRFTRI